MAFFWGILGPQCSSTLYFVWLYNYFDLNVIDESYVDETRVCRIKSKSRTFNNKLCSNVLLLSSAFFMDLGSNSWISKPIV